MIILRFQNKSVKPVQWPLFYRSRPWSSGDETALLRDTHVFGIRSWLETTSSYSAFSLVCLNIAAEPKEVEIISPAWKKKGLPPQHLLPPYTQTNIWKLFIQSEERFKHCFSPTHSIAINLHYCRNAVQLITSHPGVKCSWDSLGG